MFLRDAQPEGSQSAMTISIKMASGLMTLEVRQADLPWERLFGMASRRNPRRGYLFVSKVLGKHIPVRPATIEDTHRRLARKLLEDRVLFSGSSEESAPLAVVGLAETATGLAHGVYDQLLARRPFPNSVFQHTTRVALRRRRALEFSEPHSHAPQHWLYDPPDDELRNRLCRARTLVLVDDEISTGRTLANLAAAFRRLNPQLKSLAIVSLTNWLSESGRAKFAERAGMPARFFSLLNGAFRFQKSEAFGASEFDEVENSASDPPPGDANSLPTTLGRLGRAGPLEFDFAALADSLRVAPRERVLVLGTGEFLHPPFLLARWLEARGADVRFQSTTRSPILIGGAVTSVTRTVDPLCERLPNFVYNAADRNYDRILICYETPTLPESHRLPEQLNATAVYFGDAGARIQ